MELRVTSVGVMPPFPHLATVERDRAVGTSPSGNRLPADFDTHIADLPCAYWEPDELPLASGAAGLRLGPAVNVVAEGPRMLIPSGTDVGVGDRIVNVRAGTGVITAGPLRIVVDRWRRTHRELALEQAGGRVPAEAS